jgi:hypothetical protein
VASAGGEVVSAGSPVPDPATGDSTAPAAGTSGEAGGTEAASRAAGVLAAVADYTSAIEARDLARLARAYPAMTEQQRRGWTTFFNSVADLRARLVVAGITTVGTTAARAHVRGTYEYQNLRPHRAERSPVSFTVLVARDATGWRVRAVE